MGNFTSVMGKGPEQFQFTGNVARISASSDDTQRVVDYFKQWLPLANRVYIDKVKGDMAESERKQRAELQKRIQEEEERARVKKNLKF